MPMLPRLLTGMLFFAAALPCQKEEGTADVKSAEDARRAKAAAREERGLKGEAGEMGEEDGANLTPEQRLARNVTHGAQAYCRFLATTKPEKLMPGQTGTLTILATLQGNAVLPAPASFQVLNAAQQGELSLGTLSARPATVGRHAAGYLGRPVYDNYAVLEAPVTLAPSAQVGSKHVVAVELQFDLYDGNSAQTIGRFIDRVATTVEVGKTPDPVVQGGVRPASSVATAPAANVPPPTSEPEERASTPPEVVAPRLEANTVVPQAPAPAPAPAAPATTEAPPVVGDGDSGLPLPLLIGGGALLLAVVVLLARRR
jgi:hypothetical protein